MTSSKVWPCAALRDESLSDRTTMHVGGHAEWLLEPSDPDELRLAWCEARERGFMPRILGGGANLVIEDGTLPGVVISTARMRRTFRPLPPDTDPDGEDFWDDQGGAAITAPMESSPDPRLVAWAGASMPGLVRTAQELGWTGLEGLVGVPGSLGGGLAMNAGGGPGWMWDIVESIRVLTVEGEFRDLERSECNPGYRDGGLEGAIATGAVLCLAVDTKAAVQERTREFLLRKKAVQPVTEWSAGCIFKNPDPEAADGRSAGKLVEDCGGKGLSRGGAIVSPVHGNFIVNTGTATSADVFALIEDVRDRVHEHAGVRLSVEVVRWTAGE